jgi:hypothetical protein
VETQWPAHVGQHERIEEDAQKDCPARPQANRNRRRYRPHFVGPFALQWSLANGKPPPALPTSENLNRYVEDFEEQRTTLADFFSIRLVVRFEARRGLVEYGRSGAREGFVVCVVEGIDTELDQAGRQQVEEFF